MVSDQETEDKIEQLKMQINASASDEPPAKRAAVDAGKRNRAEGGPRRRWARGMLTGNVDAR